MILRIALVALVVSGWGLAGYLLLHPPVSVFIPPVAAPAPLTPVPPSLSPVASPIPSVPMVVNPLQSAFDDFAAQPALKGALLGFCILDEKGEPLYGSPLAETALCPASALKTVTTGAALDVLGEDFRFETAFVSSVAIDRKSRQLAGDLILKGGGDPTLSEEELEAMVDALVAQGAFHVQGKLRADTSVFPDVPVSDHWNWGDIGNAYGAGAYGLNLEHNRFTATFTPGKTVGSPANLLEAEPLKEGTETINRVLTGPAGSGDGTMLYTQPHGKQVILSGTVPLGEADFSTGGAIPDPIGLALELAKDRLKEKGVTFGEKELKPTSPSTVILASHRSAPLPEIIDHLHFVSDNLEAQCLFLTMGQKAQADPATALRKHWEDAGVSFTALRLLDGNGLARADMIRPLDLARVNLTIRHGAHGDRFLKSLKVYANGTISSKLGAMSGVRTEVGFLRCASGRELTFALMSNGLAEGTDFWKLKGPFLEKVRQTF